MKILFLSTLVCSTLWSATPKLNTSCNIYTQNTYQQQDEITATVNTSTSKEQLEDLKKFFKSNNIDLDIKSVSRDESDQITGINLSLSYENQYETVRFSQNRPISEIQLGLKNNRLFFKHSNQSHLFSNGIADLLQDNQSLISSIGGNMDQILEQINKASVQISELENDDKLQDLLTFSMNSFFGDDMDFNKMREQMEQNLNQIKDQNPLLKQLIEQPSQGNSNYASNNNSKRILPQYDPNQLVIIDGEISNFDTLTILAQTNHIEAIDRLNPKTAMSLYGEKGKKGALIVSKKN